jgi:hypothetical protein
LINDTKPSFFFDRFRVAGVHRDDQIACGIERAAFGEAEAAINLHVARHRLRDAGLVRRAERRPGLKRLWRRIRGRRRLLRVRAGS